MVDYSPTFARPLVRPPGPPPDPAGGARPRGGLVLLEGGRHRRARVRGELLRHLALHARERADEHRPAAAARLRDRGAQGQRPARAAAARSPGATLTLNGERLEVQADGSFNEFLTFQGGAGATVVLRATTAQGRRGRGTPPGHGHELRAHRVARLAVFVGPRPPGARSGGTAALRRRLRGLPGQLEYEFHPSPAARGGHPLDPALFAGALLPVSATTPAAAVRAARRALPGEADRRDRGLPRPRRPAEDRPPGPRFPRRGVGREGPAPEGRARAPAGGAPASRRAAARGGLPAPDHRAAARHPHRRGEDRQLDPGAAQGDRAGGGEDPPADPVRGLVADDGGRGAPGAGVRGRRSGRRRATSPPSA